jgi:hypothetical protein
VFNTVRFERSETPMRTRLVQVTRSSDVSSFNNQTRLKTRASHLSKRHTRMGLKVSNRV